MKTRLEPLICNFLPFLHTINGCDTTSRLFGVAEGLPLKKIKTDADFKAAVETFCTKGKTPAYIIALGEKALISLYGGRAGDTLDMLRYKRFWEKVASSITTVQVRSLPPTSAAAKYHSLRVYTSAGFTFQGIFMEGTTVTNKKRRAEPDKDKNPEKKQKMSGDDLVVTNANYEGTSEIQKALKRTQADDNNQEEVASKKLKLDSPLQREYLSKPKNEEDGEKEKRKPYHQRMKHTLKCVLQQMEFYFGDSSLSKDRFLKSKVDSSPDGYVDLSIFANFNKLQTLHRDGVSRNVLIQALSRSKILQLNEDKTKVRRITPFQEISQEETDRCTIYVEYLPSHATHMWVRQVFSQCGQVEYVSLPTYKTTKQIKGFAFVEFSKAEEAERACAMLNNPLPDKEMERPGKFPKTNKALDRLQKLAPPCPVQEEKEHNDPSLEKQDDSKTATDTDARKKKKKKTKKKKPEDSVAQASNVSAEQKPAEGKKKKKKKKRKLSQSQEPSTGEDNGAPLKSDEVVESKNVEESQAKSEASAGTDSSKRSNLAAVMDDKAGEDDTTDMDSSSQVKKKKRKKKKSKGDGISLSGEGGSKQAVEEKSENLCDKTEPPLTEKVSTESTAPQPQKKLSHRERKLLRQEDIRKKKLLKHKDENSDQKQNLSETQNNSSDTQSSENVNKDLDGTQPTSILKLKKAAEKKRVEFDPVPITNEFIEAKGARKRKKQKREKPHLRVITKREWLSLKTEYIEQQKSHMKALKESLRELRQQENQGISRNRSKPVDLEDVFGTKPLKLSQEVKMANVEKMKFTPNVIVQWWCSHEMHRDKIRTMFKESHASSIAYIDANEEARSGYIRFKDETSAEEFAKMSRTSASFMARVLPADQQEEYWEKANADRMKKLGRKKKEQGCDR
ncbi:La-related protein 7, partial [Elysia marginata]